jgi:hypothetical protein
MNYKLRLLEHKTLIILLNMYLFLSDCTSFIDTLIQLSLKLKNKFIKILILLNFPK